MFNCVLVEIRLNFKIISLFKKTTIIIYKKNTFSNLNVKLPSIL